MSKYITYHSTDGAPLVFQSYGEPSQLSRHAAAPQVLLLLHGFTGSSQYFVRNFETLSKHYWVVAPDLRGHGLSTKSNYGYHVARLAVDLHSLIRHIRGKYPRPSFVGIGCSLGAAILWMYAELFDSNDFAGMIFVDQAPLQDYIPEDGWDELYGNYGCHDAKSLAEAQKTLIDTPKTFYRGLVADCLAYRFRPKNVPPPSEAEVRTDEAFFLDISCQGDKRWFAKLLANHTSYDHRNTLVERLEVPCYVMAGEYSGCFPLAGMAATTSLINAVRPGQAETITIRGGHCELSWRRVIARRRLSSHYRDVLRAVRNLE